MASSLANSPFRNNRSRVVLIVVYASPRDGSSSAATCRAEAFPSLTTDPITAASRSPSSIVDRELLRFTGISCFLSQSELSTPVMDSQGPEIRQILQSLSVNLFLDFVVWGTQMFTHCSRLQVSDDVDEFVC